MTRKDGLLFYQLEDQFCDDVGHTYIVEKIIDRKVYFYSPCCNDKFFLMLEDFARQIKKGWYRPLTFEIFEDLK